MRAVPASLERLLLNTKAGEVLISEFGLLSSGPASEIFEKISSTLSPSSSSQHHIVPPSQTTPPSKMAVIESIAEDSQPSSSTSRTALPKPPPRSGDFSYAQPASPHAISMHASNPGTRSRLFMKDLPTDSESDTALEALQSLAFDGAPDEVALNFKSQANDYFKSKRYREALGFYTQGIDAQPEDKGCWRHCMRIERLAIWNCRNYGATLRDTSAVLGINARSEKAYYRATRALLALDRCQDAVDCAEHGLAVNPDNEAIRSLKTKAGERSKSKRKPLRRQRRGRGGRRAWQKRSTKPSWSAGCGWKRRRDHRTTRNPPTSTPIPSPPCHSPQNGRRQTSSAPRSSSRFSSCTRNTPSPTSSLTTTRIPPSPRTSPPSSPLLPWVSAMG